MSRFLWFSVHMCISMCTTVIHNTAKNSFDNLPCYSPENHHCLDVVYWMGGDANAVWTHNILLLYILQLTNSILSLDHS